MAKIDTKELFERAQELREQKLQVMAEQRANREILRNLDQSSMLSEQESDLLEEIYPVRTRGNSDELDEG